MYHDRCCAICQRTVNHVSVPCDPATIGGTPINIAWMIVENIFESCCCINQISCGGMKNALWFPGRAATWKEESFRENELERRATHLGEERYRLYFLFGLGCDYDYV